MKDPIEAMEKHSILFAFLCITLFILTFGIGYVVMGLMIANYAAKRNWGMDGLGILFLWPIALYVYITCKEDFEDE
jgi:hypothetical protein